MAKDLFGGLGSLGGILGGIAKNVVPKDTPEGKLLHAQGELADFHKQESELLLAIGKEAYERDPSAWPQHSKLQLVRQNMETAKAALDEAKHEQERTEAEEAAREARGRCTNCGNVNAEGVKFCQECGNPLAQEGPRHCTVCGMELASGTRFCGGCGNQV